MANGLITIVDAFSAVISPVLEATFDYVEYRMAVNHKWRRKSSIEQGEHFGSFRTSRVSGSGEFQPARLVGSSN